MSAAQWGVLAGGIGVIALINWYFFAAGDRPATPTASAAGRDPDPR